MKGKQWSVAFPMCPNWGLNLQPRQVPWPGMELGTFCFAGWCPTNWATPSGLWGVLKLLIHFLVIDPLKFSISFWVSFGNLCLVGICDVSSKLPNWCTQFSTEFPCNSFYFCDIANYVLFFLILLSHLLFGHISRGLSILLILLNN